MIARIRGRLLEKEPNQLVVDASGVGYALSVPISAARGEIGDEVDLFVHTEVRQDAIQLFGFSTREEREVFRRLKTVQGVGSQIALAVLSGLPLPDLISTVVAQDAVRLTSIPRVGRKTAERIVLELKEKLPQITTAFPAPAGAGHLPPGSVDADALTALENLGYKAPQARSALQKAREALPDGPLEALLRNALKILSP
jgi:holliday junction DNA helicase RuvA